jgi:diguanylate cyclase (GGDEF)-like protein/PAS domain S-box-containing protein
MSNREQGRTSADRRWETALDMAHLGVWDWNLSTGECFYSASWKRMLGYEPGELEDHPDLWIDLVHPDDRQRAIESGERHMAGETAWIETEFRLRHKDGSWRWIIDRGGIVERDTGGRATRLIGVQTDITSQKNAERELERLNQRFRLALDASGIGIWQYDVDSERVYWDERMREIYGIGHGPSEVPRSLWHEHLHDQDAEETERRTFAIFDDREPIKLNYRIVRSDGEVRHVESLVQFVSGNGASERLVGTIRDVTDEQAQQRVLARAATHDPLTGVLNRAAFDEALADAIEGAVTQPFALFYIDLDHFKALNDYSGHAAGDAALKSVTGNLQLALPPGARVGRLGGDEFAAIAPCQDVSAAEHLGEDLLQAVRQSDTGAAAWRQQLAASIGICVVDDDNLTATDLLAKADDACYAAKSAGRNCCSIADTTASAISGLTAVRLASDIADATDSGRFLIYGQQIRDIERPWKESRRHEVLARLLDVNGKMVSPAHFIPAAERFGMASRIDRYMMSETLKRFGTALAGSDGVRIGFNISAQTLSEPDLWDFVIATIDRYGAAPDGITFEITETAAVTNFTAAERFVKAARQAGSRISLDDFGAGLSSFAYLRRFTVDSIKIDGAFVRDVAKSKFDRAIVSSIARIATDLEFDVVAEKIEDPEAIPVLRDLNVKFAQGFALHKPEPLEDILVRGGWIDTGRLTGTR